MAQASLAALLLASTAVLAQTPPAQDPPPPPEVAEPASDELRREVDQKVEAAKQELREELRAQLATQSAQKGFEDEWIEPTQKLELFEVDGYFRTRPDLFHKFDLGRAPDPSGYTLFPTSPTSARERTHAGVNMRLRLDPTLNVSEEVRIKGQFDVLDNVVFGASPLFAGPPQERVGFAILENSMLRPRSQLLSIKRVYGEVSTPVGIVRFGRMGSHWGLGMLHNDGDCLDCDFGDSIDRIQFVTEPVPGWFVAPMLDFYSEGPTSAQTRNEGQPFDLSNADDLHGLVVAVARRDTDQQVRAKLANDLPVLNYGLHFSYRFQRYEQLSPSLAGTGVITPEFNYVNRSASLYIPDLWVKYERKAFRLELEAAAVLGTIENRALTEGERDLNQALSVVQFGAVAQGEYRFMDGQLNLLVEAGFASGDQAPGMGNYPGRDPGTPDGNPVPGNIEGRQYLCQGVRCSDAAIRNFRFNQDYRVDLILFRELLGGITDTIYLRPNLTYRVADGLFLSGQIVASRAVYQESTPATNSPWLGVEAGAAATYETEDGFFAGLRWGILFPMAGLRDPSASADQELETPQAFRGVLGVKF
jgi:uncharacterized protein (TIGR04551 family)